MITGMSTSTLTAALMSTMPLPEPGEAGVAPEWIQVLPAIQGELRTHDHRGPYIIDDIDALIAASFAEARTGKIPIDQDHAMDKAAPRGDPAPSRGWITELQAREDGLFAKVEWTKVGAELVSDRAYGGVSPVLMVPPGKKNVKFIREVSLVNRPNLRDMAALQSQESSEMLNELIQMLGLAEDATEEQVKSKIKSLTASAKEASAQSEDISAVAKAAGLKEDATVEEITAAVQTTMDASSDTEKTITALQAQVNVLEGDGKRRDAESAVREARAKGKAIGSATEKVLISLHSEGNMEAFDEMVAAQTDTTPTHTGGTAPDVSSAAMSAEDISDKATAYMKKCADEGRIVSAAQAVDHVMEESQ